MGWEIVDTEYRTGGSAQTLASTGTIAVEVGDLIVFFAGTNHATIYPDDAYDDAANEYTHRSVVNGGGDCWILTSYAVATTGGATTFTVHSSGTPAGWLWLMVIVYRPDDGDTVEFDVGGTVVKEWNSGTWTTATANTTGDDEVIAAAFFEPNGVGWSAREIPSAVAATDISPSANIATFYRIATETITGCCAEANVGNTTGGCGEFVAFKATASEPPSGLSIPIVERYYRGVRAA